MKVNEDLVPKHTSGQELSDVLSREPTLWSSQFPQVWSSLWASTKLLCSAIPGCEKLRHQHGE